MMRPTMTRRSVALPRVGMRSNARQVDEIAATGERIRKAFAAAQAKVRDFGAELRLVGVTGTKASAVLGELEGLAGRTPLTTEDVVQGYIKLRASGVEPTVRELESLGAVAHVMERDFGDVVGAMVSTSTDSLRRLGIEVERSGDKAILTSGTMRREVENNTAAIREGLVDLAGERYGEGAGALLRGEAEREREAALTAAKREELEKRQADLQRHLEQQRRMEEMYSRFRLDMARTMTHGLVSLGMDYAKKYGQSQRAIAVTGKVLGMIQATVDAFVAANSAMRDTPGPYPVKAAAYGLTLGKGMASVALIGAQPLARGTPFFGGGMALVGEEGPELLRLPRGTQVYNSRQTRNSIGSVNFPVSITVNGNASDTTVAGIRNSLGDFAGRMEDALRYGYLDPRRLGFVMH